MKKNYWLMKSEPQTFSIDDLKKDKKSLWDGVRNYQARNYMINDMSVGDEVLFYHSNAKPPGVAGLAIVSGKARPDPSQYDKKSEYYDPKATANSPRWQCVEVQYKSKLNHYVSLEEIKSTSLLKDMVLVKPGSRLSIQPVTKKEFDLICKMGS